MTEWRAIRLPHLKWWVEEHDAAGRYVCTISGPHDEPTAKDIAAVKEMKAALLLHQAWADAESGSPDYGTLTRDTHPDGEEIWRRWFDANLSLCDRANQATSAALAKAGE